MNLFWKIFAGPTVHGHRTVSSWKIGVGVLVFALLVGWVSFNKIMVKEWFTPSETVKVHLAANNLMVPYYSKAKVNFVPVGLVTGVERQPDNSAIVTLEVSPDVPGKLGTAPTATVRPTTLLGGNYFLDLKPGGLPGNFQGIIPVERTALPVELDKVLASFQPAAMEGMRGTLKEFDQTLGGGGGAALQRLVADIPGSLKPTSIVLDALRGTNPQHDLTDLVEGFESTARAATDKPGQLRDIATSFGTTARILGSESSAFSTTLQELPSSLSAADSGLRRLNTTLDTLRDTADDIRPSAKQLGKTLDRVDPVLDHARPVVHDLRDLLKDLRPTVNDAIPVTKDVTDVFDDLSGPVLDRVNGPIKDQVLGDFHGTGPYNQTQTQKPIFEELGYMVNNLDRATLMDRNGGGLAFQPDPHGLELMENLFQNNGQPRVETLQRSLTDPQRVSPPLQAPRALQPPHPGGDNFGTGQQLLGGLGGGHR